VYIINLIK